ncbi:MAG: permease prefix domain 1-containing protein [Armatimonadota bacterium]
MDDRLSKLAEEASAALRDDPELRLEVKAELTAHLEETAQTFAEEGKDETESIDLAVKAFGPAPEVAQQLLAANQRRMKLRALARLVLRAAIIPAAVILAVVIGYGRLINLGNTLRMWSMLSGLGSESSPFILFNLDLPLTLSADDQYDRLQKWFIFSGDRKRESRAEQQRAIWEKQPENTVYLANYVSTLMRGYFGEVAEQDMRQGEKLDTDNAIYHYCLARSMDHDALVIMDDSQPRANDRPGSERMFNLVYSLQDRQKLDRAMAEVRRGLEKPFTSAYHRQMLHERLAVLPSDDCFRDATMQLLVSASVLLPEYSHYRQIAREMPYYGQLLLAEGRRKEAEIFLDGWQRLPVQILNGEDSLIGVLVAVSCAKITGEGAAEVYERFGEPERARKIRIQLARFLKPHERWDRWDEIHSKDAGLFEVVFPPRNKPFIHAGELTPLHRLEYTLLEEAVVSLLVVFLMILLIAQVVTGLSWKLALRGEDTSPLLLLPSVKSSLRILLVGFLCPLIVYLLYSRLPVLAGRDQSLVAQWPRVGMEVLLLVLVLFVLPTSMLVREIRQKCFQVGILVPATWGFWSARMVAVNKWLGLLAFFLCLGYLLLERSDWWNNPSNLALYGLALVSVLIILGIGYVLEKGSPKIMAPARHCGVYFGSVARTLVPLYAVMVILLSGLVYPCLVQEEAYWIRRDTLVFWQEGEGSVSITPLEARVVAELKRQMLQAAE